MDIYNYGEYSYAELTDKALSHDATQKDIDTLGEWFQQYGMSYWNGESFDIDERNRIFPVYEEQDDNYEIIRYEIR